MFAAQLWQATGYNVQRQTVSRDVYFPELLHPSPVFKQLPADSMDAGQQKRAKLLNGQYRPRTATATPAYGVEPAHSGSAVQQTQHQQYSRHVTPALAAAAAAAAAAAGAQQHMASSALVSPSSSSSHDAAEVVQQQPLDGSGTQVAQLRPLPVPWPLTVSVKGRRSSRQRRTNMARWQAVLQPCAAAAFGYDAAAGDGAAVMEVAQLTKVLQQLPELEHQQSGVLADTHQQLQQHTRLPPPPPPPQLVLQEQPLRPLQPNTQQQLQQGVVHAKQQQQQKEAAALLQQMAPATPVHAKSPSPGFAAMLGAAVNDLASKQFAAETAAAAVDGSPYETSTSSEQTHDDMNDSPRDPAREPLSSWPSSSTDSICQLQQQQQQLLQQRQQGKLGSGPPARKPVVAGSWASPSSPLPASAL
jgi:hypothetical protein